MPNMSRKTIHSVHDEAQYEHKETNTEAYLSKSASQSLSAEYSGNYLRRRLFNNNRYDQHQKTVYSRSIWSRVTRSVLTVLTVVTTVFTYMFHTHVSWFSKLHKLSSKVMVMDTWLLWKNPGNKPGKLAALCLVPLFLLAGWWALSSLGAALLGAYLNSTATVHSPVAESSVLGDVQFDVPKIQESPAELTSEHVAVITESLKQSIDIEDQLKVDSLVEKVIANPTFQTIVNNYNNVHNYEKLADANNDKIENQQKLIDGLKIEMEKMKSDMVEAEKKRLQEINDILTEYKTANSEQNAHLTYQLRQCCRKPLINIEGYVGKVVGNLLNDVEFLKTQRGLDDYLRSVFVARKDLEAELLNLTSNLNSKYESLIENNGKLMMDEVSRKIELELRENVQKFEANIAVSRSGEVHVGKISDERIKKVVKDVLTIYDADKTGLVDYAMETMGGQVLTTRCTENYHYGKAVVSVLGIPLWYPVNSPRTIITPSINPGECWAFQNFPGFVVIRLSGRVKIEAFSMEHISKLLVPNGKIDSAPKHFEVYGLTEENDKQPVKLGEYTYDADGEPLQFFAAEGDDRIFGIIELRVISNHGNPNYTCLYRFRVHGKMMET